MSLCVIYQTKNKCYVGADTAISDGRNRLSGKYEKLYNHCGQLVFCAGLAKFSKMVRDEIEKEVEIDLDTLRKYCLRNYGTEDMYYENNKKLICEIVIVKRIDGVIHSYLLSSCNNFKIEETVIDNDEEEIQVIGFNKDEVLETFKRHYYKCKGNVVVNELFKDVFNKSVCEVIGGDLDFYVLVEGNYSGTPKHTNKIVQYKFELNDKYRVNTINKLNFMDRANLFMGLETDEDGKRRAKLKLRGEDNELVLTEGGLLQQYVVGDRNDNLDSTHPLNIDFVIDVGFVSIKNLKLNLKLEKFRCYSETTLNSTETTSTSESNTEVSTETTTGGGGYYASTETSENGHLSGMGSSERIYVSLPILDQTENMYNHSHYLSEGTTMHSHRYSVSVPSHYHSYASILKSHSHQYKLLGHKHNSDLGIFEYNNIPVFSVYLDNEFIFDTSNDILEFDLASRLKYLAGRHNLSIISKANGINPKGLGRVSVSLFLKGFAVF